jgi:hypothetical protein
VAETTRPVQERAVSWGLHSYSSIAAYRSDAHRLLVNVMAGPITGRRSWARSGNDHASRGWPLCLKTAASRNKALVRGVSSQRAAATVPGPVNVGCTDVSWRPLSTSRTSPRMPYLTTRTQISVDYSPGALEDPANRRRPSSDLQGSAWSAADSARAGATLGAQAAWGTASMRTVSPAGSFF